MRFIGFSDFHVDHYLRGKRGNEFNLRTEDMLASLDLIVDKAIEIQAEAVLFAGDMYHTHLPKPQIKAAVHRRIIRLTKNGIKLFAIPGNHDKTPTHGSVDTLAELTTLEVEGVYVFHDPSYRDMGTYGVVGIPWMYDPYVPVEYPKDKPVYCIAHANVEGATYHSGADTTEMQDLKDFRLSLDDLIGFTFSLLGHIHKPQVLADNVLYPGSVGSQDWGEVEEHYYVVIDGDEWELVPYKDRQRIFHELNEGDEIPPMEDANAFYRFSIPYGFPRMEIESKYKEAYSLEITVRRESHVTNRRETRLKEGMTDMEMLQEYFSLQGWEFPKQLALEVFSEVRK